MAKNKQENTYPLPEGYDVKDGPLYIPADLLEGYKSLEAYPDTTPLTKVLEIANKLIDLKAEARVKDLPKGPPRDLSKDEAKKYLEELLDSVFVPLARHHIRLGAVRSGERNRREALVRFQAHLETHTCSVCGELSHVAPRARVALTGNLSNEAPQLTGRVCLNCEVVARALYAEQVGSQQTGHATRAEKVRRALSGAILAK